MKRVLRGELTGKNSSLGSEGAGARGGGAVHKDRALSWGRGGGCGGFYVELLVPGKYLQLFKHLQLQKY